MEGWEKEAMGERDDKEGGEEHNYHLSLTKLVVTTNNNQPTMEDKGNDTNALNGSGSCVEVVVEGARRVAREVFRVVAVVVAEKQQSTNNGG